MRGDISSAVKAARGACIAFSLKWCINPSSALLMAEIMFVLGRSSAQQLRETV